MIDESFTETESATKPRSLRKEHYCEKRFKTHYRPDPAFGIYRCSHLRHSPARRRRTPLSRLLILMVGM